MRLKKTLVAVLMCLSFRLSATVYLGNPSDFRDKIALLAAGDTLYLVPGNYSLSLRLTSIVGSVAAPILIAGQPGQANKPVFLGNACCNTVALRSCEFLHLKDIRCDGQNIAGIDAVKAEGGAGYASHDIEIEGFEIVNYGASQQNVGISTKTPCWNWWVHHNIIDEAGTGMYFGDSNGEQPFVNSLIEYNLITNTVGYNCQVKHQNVNTRDLSIGMPAEGITIIRYNVFSKDENASSGGLARPNLLVGNFPSTGNGSSDHYEIYGNLFFQNPMEGLFQGTGNIAFYDNLLFNDDGGWGISIQTHVGFQPRNIDIFHNTVLVEGATGISLTGLDANFVQRVYANAVFASTGISGGTQSQNVTETYMAAGNYLKGVNLPIVSLELSPLVNALDITGINLSVFSSYSDHDLDFDGKNRGGTFAGAYFSTNGAAWPLDLVIRDEVTGGSVSTSQVLLDASSIALFPCPTNNLFQIEGVVGSYDIDILDVMGSVHQSLNSNSSPIVIDVQALPAGTYFVAIHNKTNSQLHVQKMIKN